MRIYEGSPRQNWEEVLRSIGAFADREQLKELLFLELDGGFLMQGLTLPRGGASSDSYGTLAKRTYELTDEQVAQLIEERTALRGTAVNALPAEQVTNFYEHALRVIGAYLDKQSQRDLFFFEQEGSFVLRVLVVTSTCPGGHQLVEFTREDIMAMIMEAPHNREDGAPSA
jgi:hypothetical protein